MIARSDLSPISPLLFVSRNHEAMEMNLGREKAVGTRTIRVAAIEGV